VIEVGAHTKTVEVSGKRTKVRFSSLPEGTHSLSCRQLHMSGSDGEERQTRRATETVDNATQHGLNANGTSIKCINIQN
jgi:hypothetical protein